MPGWGCTLRTVRGPEKLVLPSAELGQCSSHRSALPNTLLGLHDFLLLVGQKKESHKKDREVKSISPLNLWRVRMQSKNTWVHTWTEPQGSVSELVVPEVMGGRIWHLRGEPWPSAPPAVLHSEPTLLVLPPESCGPLSDRDDGVPTCRAWASQM